MVCFRTQNFNLTIIIPAVLLPEGEEAFLFHPLVCAFEDVFFKVIIGCCDGESCDSIIVVSAVISPRERGKVDCPGQEEADLDEGMDYVFSEAGVLAGIMLVYGYHEFDDGVPGEVS